MKSQHHPHPAKALHERLTGFLRKLANGKGAPQWRRREALELLRAVEEGADSPHYVQPREGWEPGPAFESHDRPRGNIEPEEGAVEKPRVCRECGCTDDRACMTPAGPCYWIEPGLCSAH